jgi:hypothetical protein
MTQENKPKRQNLTNRLQKRLDASRLRVVEIDFKAVIRGNRKARRAKAAIERRSKRAQKKQLANVAR